MPSVSWVETDASVGSIKGYMVVTASSKLTSRTEEMLISFTTTSISTLKPERGRVDAYKPGM